MGAIVTFGEIMLRLSTPTGSTIDQTHGFMAHYGGGEANVAVALAHMGHPARFVSRLPQNQLGDGAVRHLLANGVNVDHILRGGSNIGVYFLETGFGGRPSKVLYNRKHSAFTRIDADNIDWAAVFADADWFHVSGITLALGERVRRAAFRAAREAKAHGATVSFDFNYRSRLWPLEEACPVYRDFVPLADVAFARPWDAQTLLGLPAAPNAASEPERRRKVLGEMMRRHGIACVFGTERTVHSATENSLSGYFLRLRPDGTPEHGETPPVRFSILDRIGGGDAFAGGVIHGLLSHPDDPAYAVRYGLAASVLKHTIAGDAALFPCRDIEAFMDSNGSAEVVR